MEDAELVSSAIAKSPDAFAAIYDRYVDRIFDYARSVLRSDADAADVTQDTFLTASQRLDQLRDASRLRPWLYAIARSHSFRTIRERQRTQVSSDVDEVVEMNAPDGEIDARELVWAAAAGLAPSDRDILDLHLRQDLDGQDLADALGVTPNVANVALHRIRTRLEQSVGAVLLARTANKECGELDELMADGMSPLVRKRVARHIDTCTICDDRRRAMTSPSVLFAATPLALAPLLLRDRVLGSVGSQHATAASDSLGWRDDGFPSPEAIPEVVGPDSDTIAGQPTKQPAGPGIGRTTRGVNPLAIASSAAVVLLAVVGLFFIVRSSSATSVENAKGRIGPDATESGPLIADLPAPTTTLPETTLAGIPSDTSTPLAIAPGSATTAVPAGPDVEADSAPPPALDPSVDPPPATSTVADTTVPATTTVPEPVPVPPPVISLVDAVCASTMQVVVDIDSAVSITGTFETEAGLSAPLIVHPTIAGRFSAELAIGEGRVTPLVVATGAAGIGTLTLDDCIVIG